WLAMPRSRQAPSGQCVTSAIPFHPLPGQMPMKPTLWNILRKPAIVALVAMVAGGCTSNARAGAEGAGAALAMRGGAGGRRIEVLFLGHQARHHPSDSAAAFLVPALGKEGINFQYTTDPNDLNRENLKKYDAVLLYANHDSITPSQEAALLEFVRSGNGFVPIHSASHSFRNSAA